MSFNLSYFDGFGTSGFPSRGKVDNARYTSIAYRQYITQIALDFYYGEMDGYMYEDLVAQGRDPTKVQFTPINLTREIVDSISLLYREPPIRTINGTAQDKKLWEEIETSTRLNMKMKKLDRWVHLLGTVLVKVAYRAKNGELVSGGKVVDGKGMEGNVEIDLVTPSCFDVAYIDNPYVLSEVAFGLGTGFDGILTDAQKKERKQISNPTDLKIFWTPDSHWTEDSNGKIRGGAKSKNPYGIIPAVPFFNQDPDYYFFLPIDEPLIYMNHAINMRISDLNHIAKFQSFGVPVFKGMERGTSIERPLPQTTDDLSKGKVFQFGSRTGGRLFKNRVGFDGNALAMGTGVSFGPDVGIATGAEGDFKFESPNADLEGLTTVINHLEDWVRQTYHLTPKALQLKTSPQSGFSLWMEKLGVLENLNDRQELFREREMQLFEIVKRMWNLHNPGRKFTDSCTIQITYKQPVFPVNPKDQLDLLERKLADGFMTMEQAYKEMYPHLTEKEIKKLRSSVETDVMDRAKKQAEVDKISMPKDKEPAGKSPAEIAEDKSIQPGQNLDGRDKENPDDDEEEES